MPMKNLFSRFAREEHASVAIEGMIVVPILAWAFIASFIFFDAFRSYNTSIKASYAVADVLSRRTDEISSTDIEGLSDVFQYLSRGPAGTQIRVTQITRQTNGFRIDWSHGTDGMTYLRESSFEELRDRVPVMAFGDRMLLIETYLPYRPAFDIGLDDQEYFNFTTTRPRFAGQVAFDPNLDNSYVYDGSVSPTGEDGFVPDPVDGDDPDWDNS